MNLIYGIGITLCVLHHNCASELNVIYHNGLTPLFATAHLAIDEVEVTKVRMFTSAEGALRAHILAMKTLTIDSALEIYRTKAALLTSSAYDGQSVGASNLHSLLVKDMRFCLLESRNRYWVSAKDIRLDGSLLNDLGSEARSSLHAVEHETRRLVAAIRMAKFNDDFQILLGRAYFILSVVCSHLFQSGLIASDECNINDLVEWFSQICRNEFIMCHIRISAVTLEPPVLKSVVPRPLLSSVDMDALTKITKNNFSVDVELAIIYCGALKQLPLCCRSDFVSLVQQYSFTGGAIQDPFIVQWSKDYDESCSLLGDIKQLAHKHDLGDSMWLELFHSWFRLKKIMTLLGIQGYSFFYLNFPVIIEFYKSTQSVVILAILNEWSTGYETLLDRIENAVERASLEYKLWNAIYKPFKGLKYKLSALLSEASNAAQLFSRISYSQLTSNFIVFCNRNIVGISPVICDAITTAINHINIPVEKLIQFNGFISSIEYAIINYQLSYLSDTQGFTKAISAFVAGILEELDLFCAVLADEYEIPGAEENILPDLLRNIAKYVFNVLQFHDSKILANVSFFIGRFDCAVNPSGISGTHL